MRVGVQVFHSGARASAKYTSPSAGPSCGARHGAGAGVGAQGPILPLVLPGCATSDNQFTSLRLSFSSILQQQG